MTAMKSDLLDKCGARCRKLHTCRYYRPTKCPGEHSGGAIVMARIAKVRAGILVFVMLAGLPAIGDLPFDRSAEAAEPDQPIAITQSPLQLPNPFAESAGHEQYSVDVLTNIDQNRDQPQPGPLAIVPVESPYAPDASIPFMMINPGSNQHRKTRPQGAKSGTTTHIASLSKNITSDHRVNLDYKPDMPRSYLATCLSAIDPIGAGAAAGATALGVTAAAPEAPATTAVVLPEVDVTATAPDCQLRIKEHRQDTRESFRDLTSNALYVWTKIDDSGAFIGTEVAYTLDQSFFYRC